MLTRKEIVDYSVRMGTNQDLLNKGMATTPFGDVFCIATLSGVYPDEKYYAKGHKSPKEVLYCGVYGKNAPNRLYIGNYETRKNIAVTKTDGSETFVYFFEKTSRYINEYFFHGRYKYICHEMIKSIHAERDEEILFHLSFVDRPTIN